MTLERRESNLGNIKEVGKSYAFDQVFWSIDPWGLSLCCECRLAREKDNFLGKILFLSLVFVFAP